MHFVSFSAWLGYCTRTVLCGLLAGVAAVGRALLRVLRVLLQHIWQLLCQPVHNEAKTALLVQRSWLRARRRRGLAKCMAFLQMIWSLLLSEHGILVALFRFAVPLTCVAFLAALVRYGTTQAYGIAVWDDTEMIGMVETEADYLKAQEIARKRLSYSDSPSDESAVLRHSISLERCDASLPLLTAGALADQMLLRADIELCDAYGVYVNEDFLGAVADPKPIEAALVEQLSRYSERLDGAEASLAYADSVTYENGIFLAENLVTPDKIVQTLTSTNREVISYNAIAGDTVYSVAARFSLSPADIRRMNPALTEADLIPEDTRLRIQTEQRYLPIVYTKIIEQLAFIPYATVRTESGELAKGTEVITTNGVRGEKEQTIEITYTDGRETRRHVTGTRLLSEPVNEEIRVGTFEAEPYSKDTVIDGNGHFLWPLRGGRITSLFGGDRQHRGLDIGAAGGTEIYAADGGVVLVSGWNDSYGNYIVIDHGDGFKTLYAHCSALLAAVNETVRPGQLIALVGTTGHSSGEHLHFEVYVNGINENPALYLRVNADG